MCESGHVQSGGSLTAPGRRRGHFATVFSGKRKIDSVPVAIKVIDKESSNKEALKREVDMMRMVGAHPDIVRFYDVFETPEAVQMVMELCVAALVATAGRVDRVNAG